MRFSVRSVRTVLVARSEKKKERKKKKTGNRRVSFRRAASTGDRTCCFITNRHDVYIRSSSGAARYERQQAFIIDVNTAE